MFVRILIQQCDAIPRSCRHLFELGVTEPGLYPIDLDGDGPKPLLHVNCSFTEDLDRYIIHHNLENGILQLTSSFELSVFCKYQCHEK